MSYSDLLLSVATAQWDEKEKNAREEIDELVNNLNDIGNGFNIDKDFVLKAALYLTKKIENIRFQANNFKKENMNLIRKNWDNIVTSLYTTFKLLYSFGYDKMTLSSSAPVFPIALYILKNNVNDKIISSRSYKEDRELIKEWLIKSILKKTLTGAEDKSKKVRDIILKDNSGKFPLTEIKNMLNNVVGKSLDFSENEIKNLLKYKYNKNGIFSILQLLYPNLNYKNKFHIDHIYPKSKFNEKYLKKLKIKLSDLEDCNLLANLQLLDGNQNLEKSDKEVEEWLKDLKKDEKKKYFKDNYIPNMELTFKNYSEFFKEREKLLLKQLKKILLEKE